MSVDTLTWDDAEVEAVEETSSFEVESEHHFEMLNESKTGAG